MPQGGSAGSAAFLAALLVQALLVETVLVRTGVELGAVDGPGLDSIRGLLRTMGSASIAG